MAEQAYLSSGDTDVLSSALYKYIFALEHFQLNAYTQMRVYLAIQFTYQSMIACIREYCQNSDAHVEDYRA